jgi:hypothetical protein
MMNKILNKSTGWRNSFYPYDQEHDTAYLRFPEYCFLLPGKKYINIDSADVSRQLENPANTVVYDSAGYIKIRLGQ